MPTFELSKDSIANGLSILDLIVLTKIAPSKGQARTLVEQGGISINDEKITDAKHTISLDLFNNDVILKKGKKVFIKIIAK